jgi:hypothetical protein
MDVVDGQRFFSAPVPAGTRDATANGQKSGEPPSKELLLYTRR